MRSFKNIFLKLLIVFSFLFPKGGVKIADVPITWGYLLLFIISPVSVLLLFRKIELNRGIINKKRLMALVCCLPFIFYSVVVLLFKDIESLGFFFSFLLSLIFMPVIFLLLLGPSIDRLESGSFPKIFLWCIRLVVVFGLFLFFTKLAFNYSVEIPFLTINAGDVDAMDEKYNNRSGISKLISTFNNGNIYGICMLIIMPLYLKFEKRRMFFLLFFLSLFLTLSRTVWIGAVLYFVLYLGLTLRKKTTIFIIGTAIIASIFLFPAILSYFNLDLDFLFDRNLGGRMKQVDSMEHVSLFGVSNFKGIAEIVYLSILDTFGIIGFVSFLFYMFSPLIAYYLSSFIPKSREILPIFGCLIYIVIAAADGAMLYIPVMAYFWFIASYSLRRI